MRPGLDVGHLLVDEVHDLVEGLEDVQALEVLALDDLRVQVVLDVERLRVDAPDLEDRALDALLRHVLRQLVAVDARPDRHAQLPGVGEAHGAARARTRKEGRRAPLLRRSTSRSATAPRRSEAPPANLNARARPSATAATRARGAHDDDGGRLETGQRFRHSA